MNETINNKNTLKELQKILLYKDRADDTIISLYDLSLLIKKKNTNMQKTISKNLKKIINTNCSAISMRINNVNYDTEELIIILNFDKTYTISCKKESDKLIFTETNNTPNFIVSNFNIEELSLIYNNCMKYKDYVKEEYYRVSSSNSCFLINITKEGITLFYEKDKDQKFLISSYVFKDDYILTTESTFIKDLLKNNEDLIFKNTYIKIENCPKWAQKKLYQLRQKQIIEKNLPKVRKKELTPKRKRT